MRQLCIGGWFLLAWVITVQAGPIAPEAIPEPLRPWQDWVLYDTPDHACPFLYSDASRRRCAWPSELVLELDDQNGHFRQRWTVYRRSPVTLPGDRLAWPQNVTVDGRPAVVVAQAGRPVIRLAPGEHRIEGDLLWRHLPERLSVPADTGLLRLRLRGQPVTEPLLGEDGRLWLRRDKGQRPMQDTLAVTVQRRLIDDIPQRIVTRIELKVSGRVREQRLGPLLLPQTLPLRLDSPLPARLEPDGRLRLQLRPGRWILTLESRTTTDQTAFARTAAPPPWPEEEIWVFDARPDIRLVEVTGPRVDPRQTTLPGDWQKLPAFRLTADETLRLKVIRRGQAEPPPDRLSLERILWLDFDGGGYTVEDRIRGTLGRTWRLETRPELKLGRVLVDGQPRFITRLPGSERAGVEVRRGDLLLTAEARHAGRRGDLPVTGWDADFQKVGTTLHLPPGWSLFAVSGVDNVPATWLQRWTLLDLFLVLILSLAVHRLWDWRAGLVALVTLVVIWHEPLAPRIVWIHLLVAMALLRVVPHPKLQRWLRIYRDLGFVALVLITIPFAVQELRTALYPQLERPGPVAVTPVRMAEAPSLVTEEKSRKAAKPMAESLVRRDRVAPESARVITEVDPNAVVQTGPGLPRWTWRQVNLEWNGPVARDQRLSLTLIPPLGNRFLKVLRVVLVGLLGIFLLWQARGGKGFGPWRKSASGQAASVVLLLAALYSVPPPASAGEVVDVPPPDMLAELKQRLLAPADCLPACASIARMDLQADARRLRLDLEIHAAETVALPLPSRVGEWLPAQVRVDGRAATRLYREPGKGLWIGLSPGRHQVTLIGTLPERDSLILPLPLRPGYVTIRSRDWEVTGVDEEGRPEGQLRLGRRQPLTAQGARAATLTPRLPPFLRVERTLRLGLEWQVETRVFRVSPPGTPVIVNVPLLPGEAPLNEGLAVQDGQVRISLAPQQREMYWRSRLTIQTPVTLRAPRSESWMEVWRVDVSPLWHLTSEGIPPIHRHDPASNYLPEWRPWPGETVTLTLIRPRGVPGPTLTLVASERRIRPGRQASDTTLKLRLRSSQGGQYSLNLPPEAALLMLRIDGTELPARQQGRRVTIPLRPATMDVELQWRTPNGIRIRYVSEPLAPGLASVNADTRLELGRDRWVLFTGGPRLGPAVLFWGVLLVIVLLAFALGRLRLTPLRAGSWFLFGIGLSQVPLWMGAVVVAWLFALGARGRVDPQRLDGGVFNAMQLGLGLLTVIALLFLFGAVSQGLLGLPDMYISGNGSTATALNWYQDRVADVLPEVWVLSVPLWVYRGLMLAWALWLAIALLGWLKWGWQCYSHGGLWKKPRARSGKEAAAAEAPSADRGQP